MEEKELTLKGRSMEEAKNVQVIVRFEDNVAVSIPLTRLQAGLLFEVFSMYIDPRTGEVMQATDDELRYKFKIKEGD